MQIVPHLSKAADNVPRLSKIRKALVGNSVISLRAASRGNYTVTSFWNFDAGVLKHSRAVVTAAPRIGFSNGVSWPL